MDENINVDDNDDDVGGWWSQPKLIPVAFRPSELLRCWTSISLFLGF
jgi:hypothetical protein